MKIAEVVINTDVRSLDKTFHYLCPDHAQPLLRVQVPFGKGDKAVEGLITGFVEESPFKNLKTVKQLIDSSPVITPSAFELAKYLRKVCLCPLYAALKLVMPPKSGTRFVRRAALRGIPPEGMSGAQKAIVDILSQSGGRAEINSLLAAAGVKTESPLNKLCKKGIITIEESAESGVKEKLRLVCSLAMSPEEAEAALDGVKKGAGMTRAVRVLEEYGSMPLQDLLELANCSASSVRALESHGIVNVESREISRSPVQSRDFKLYAKRIPTPEQKKVLDRIEQAIDLRREQTMLLHGVTGSGKTEVFLQAVEYCIKQGRKAIVLVPEIALTPQMLERFAGRFGKSVAVLHSGLSLGERYDEWKRIKSGGADIVVGARSAVFAPLENIGLIVIDEEHESSYKSESPPRYHARDVAAFRARQEGALLLLASATPSLGSYYAALCGRYGLLELRHRYNSAPPPDIRIVDMSAELAAGNRTPISAELRGELALNLEKGEQSILFLNRRGHSTFVCCRSCGHAMSCPNCSVTLTYHSSAGRLFCHYCGHSERNPKVCPKCKSPYIRMFGTGTQKVEEELASMFPSAVIQRMDADTTSGKNKHEEILKRFGRGEVDILIGTQMVSKGLDFPNVTLVGVLAADTLLNISDFRASERAFSQLIQVCGRAGRGGAAGRAIIQTYKPRDSAVLLAKEHDYKGFYAQEIELRRQLKNPPFTRLVNLLFKGADIKATGAAAQDAAAIIKRKSPQGGIRSMYGPSPAPLLRLGGLYRFRILLKFSEGYNLNGLLEEVYNHHIAGSYSNKVILDIDIDPVSLS